MSEFGKAALAAAVFVWAACAATAQAVGQTTFEIAGPNAAIEWLTDSTFRFCRAWDGLRCEPTDVHGPTRAKVERVESASKVIFKTEYLEVEVSKPDLRLRVVTSGGEVLLSDAGGLLRNPGGVELERTIGQGERFYGLGARTEESADARGMRIQTARPFLISSKGYGVYHTTPGVYVFDLGQSRPDRCKITFHGPPRFEYWFHYGPTIKAIYEEHMEVVPAIGYPRFEVLDANELPSRAVLLPTGERPDWTSLEMSVRGLVHASLSGILNPAFDLGFFADAPPALFGRAAQFASLAPLMTSSTQLPTDPVRESIHRRWIRWRQRLIPFFLAYVEETNTRGYPMIHPMVMQFPKDDQASGLTDQFMAGDEILVAPVFTESSRRRVYLPMGRWTELHTNREYAGRQTIDVDVPEDSIPLFVRNGSIVPLAGEQNGDPMELHYFPKLAGELFLYEPELKGHSQMHAAPALDLFRLEVESKATRQYEWVAHHLERPRLVTLGDAPLVEVQDRRRLRPGTWRYDAGSKNVHVVVEAPAGRQVLVHLSF